MSSRTVNLTLLTILSVEFVSGLASYLVGVPDGRVVFWVHRAGAFALLPLLGWKLGIVARSYRKRGLTGSTALSGLLGVLFAGAFLYGVLWATTGVRGAALPVIGQVTGLGLHVTLAFALVPLLIIHAAGRWRQVRVRRPDFASRRAALRYLALTAAGATAWQASEAAARTADLSGAGRRFTGSREIGSLSGNGYPETNWLTDPWPSIAPSGWQLHISGAVARERVISWDDLLRAVRVTQRATLDCTGGWYTLQDWTGVPLTTLLAPARMTATAQSIVVRSATGYRRRYPLAEADRLLLAFQVGGQPLTKGHGAPVRLVAPGRRGYEWIKWVVAIEVSSEPAWLQSPLPLQ